MFISLLFYLMRSFCSIKTKEKCFRKKKKKFSEKKRRGITGVMCKTRKKGFRCDIGYKNILGDFYDQ